MPGLPIQIAGKEGVPGPQGKPAYTYLKAAFTMPAPQTPVELDLPPFWDTFQLSLDNARCAAPGCIIYIQGGGYFYVFSVLSDNAIEAIPYGIDAIEDLTLPVGEECAAGSLAVIAGMRGATGAAGVDGADGAAAAYGDVGATVLETSAHFMTYAEAKKKQSRSKDYSVVTPDISGGQVSIANGLIIGEECVAAISIIAVNAAGTKALETMFTRRFHLEDRAGDWLVTAWGPASSPIIEYFGGGSGALIDISDNSDTDLWVGMQPPTDEVWHWSVSATIQRVKP